MEIDTDILKAVAVCAELTGTTLSEPAARMFAADLDEHPKAEVLRALERCRRELKGRLTLSDVLSRIEEQDGRLSADEAWALCPMTEAATAVVTDEIMQALNAAQPLIDEGDKVAARMAFKSAYDRFMNEARAANKPVKWWPSLGRDASGRAGPIFAAVAVGRLGQGHAQKYLPRPEEPSMQLLGAPATKLIDSAERVKSRAALMQLRARL